LAERRPRETSRTAPPGARRVRVGRLVSAAPTACANDNRVPLLIQLRRLSYWLVVAAACAWLLWSNL
jgi:hypothetical protein